jgi:hypothetical protein
VIKEWDLLLSLYKILLGVMAFKSSSNALGVPNILDREALRFFFLLLTSITIKSSANISSL